MNLLQRFQDFIHQQNLFYPKDKLILAVSGGVDSIVLCELCKQAGYDFAMAHCNFQLREEESERDEKFVKELGKKYGVEVFVKKFDTEKYANETKKGIQEAARALLYEWFDEIVNPSANAQDQLAIGNKETDIHHSPFTTHVLTAHHADDNIETILM